MDITSDKEHIDFLLLINLPFLINENMREEYEALKNLICQLIRSSSQSKFDTGSNFYIRRDH